MYKAIMIPAKGKSKRIPNKNLQLINGESLVERCIKNIIKCKNVDLIILDTESDEISEICKKYMQKDKRLVLQNRDTDLIGDNIATPEIMTRILKKYEKIDYMGIMHVTAPFLNNEKIDQCIDMFISSTKEYDSAFTVEPLHDYLWKNEPVNFNVDCKTSTDNVELYYKLTGGFFISSKEYILENKTFIGKNPLLFPVSGLEGIDINYLEDLKLSRIIDAGIRKLEEENKE